MNELAQAAVARGAQVLDTGYPGWRQHVDFDALDMSTLEDCLLAQVVRGVEGDYDRPGTAWGDGMRRLFGGTDSATSVRHGFDAIRGCGFTHHDLYEAWRELLEERVGFTALPDGVVRVVQV